MGIEDDIFDEFFDKLKENSSIPEISRKELQRIWKNKKIISQEEIIEIIEMGINNVNKSQRD